MRRALLPFALCVAAGIAAPVYVHAAPLDTDACAKLKLEREALEQAGVRGNMAKGPQWAKANLPADKLDQIQRLLDLEGQLLFRCSGQRLIELPAGVEADPAAVVPSEDAAEGKAATEPGGKAEATPPAAKKAPVAKTAPATKAPATAKVDEKAKAPAAKAGDKGTPAAKAAPAKRAPEKAAKDEAEPPAKAAAKPKAKAKTKADDAYKPPPSDPANPFPKAPE
jgi:hypothetical protein